MNVVYYHPPLCGTIGDLVTVIRPKMISSDRPAGPFIRWWSFSFIHLHVLSSLVLGWMGNQEISLLRMTRGGVSQLALSVFRAWPNGIVISLWLNVPAVAPVLVLLLCCQIRETVSVSFGLSICLNLSVRAAPISQPSNFPVPFPAPRPFWFIVFLLKS